MPTLFRSTFRYMGKRYERSSTKSQRDADRNADKLRKELEDGSIGLSGKMRVKAWAYEWLETYKKPIITEKSYKNYKRHIEKIILPQIGGLRLNEVADVHLQRILNGRAGNSYSDVRHLRDTIKAIFKKARASRLIVYDPAEFLEMPASTKGTRRSLTEYEREIFLKVADTHHSGLMFKTMLYCGLRTGEVAALSWKDIDYKGHRINIVAAMESGRDVMKAPKTTAGIRTVPIPDDIYDDLLARKGDPFDPVFTQQTNGKRHTESSRNKAWKNIMRNMDIMMGATVYRNEIKVSVIAPDLVPYCLRHTYCTDLQNKGVPINVAKYLMGHSSISVTANIYTHITDEAIKNAADLLGVTCGVSEDKTG